PATSFAERQRLFALPRLSWADYDPKLISAGGGVFDRAAKSVPISPEMKQVFDIAEDHLTPAELIQKLLTAEVDLLFFGGIGTFVKADRKSTRLNSSHRTISYAVFCLKKKKYIINNTPTLL